MESQKWKVESWNHKKILDIIGYTSNNLTQIINTPFIVGAQYSSLSIYLNPIINTFNLLQIDASSTSFSLTDYDSFYRVVPSDRLQAEALIALCSYFGWENIGI